VQLGITFLTVLAVSLIISNVQSYRESATDPSLLKLIIGVIAFAISCFFVSVYSDSIEAIYTSFLIDKEDGGEVSGPE
jgi:hypothetical protein